MAEEWKSCVGYPGYMVSNLGNVKGPKSSNLRGSHNQGGYRTVIIVKEKKNYRRLVHRLVAEAFIPLVPDKPMVDHIDRNRENNIVSNLRWVNNSENQLNSKRTNEPYIYFSYRVNVPNHKQKNFKTIEEAILFRDSLISINSTPLNSTLEVIN